MPKKSNDKKIKEIVDSFEVAMKKGFMSELILLVLQNESCHGYKIIKEIKKRTFGVWQPSSSNIYPLLDSLSEKGLIERVEGKDGKCGKRPRKVYAITHEGEEALKILLQKHTIMVESFRSIVESTLGITGEFEPIFLDALESFIFYPTARSILEDPTVSKIKDLYYRRETIKRRIEYLTNSQDVIETIISKLENVNKNEYFKQKS